MCQKRRCRYHRLIFLFGWSCLCRWPLQKSRGRRLHLESLGHFAVLSCKCTLKARTGSQLSVGKSVQFSVEKKYFFFIPSKRSPFCFHDIHIPLLSFVFLPRKKGKEGMWEESGAGLRIKHDVIFE